MTDPPPDVTGIPTVTVPVTPDADPLLTAQEVATLLGVSERTIRRRINAGDLPSAKVGGQYRIPASVVGRVPVAGAGRAGRPAGHAEVPSGTGGHGAGHTGQAPDAPVVRDLEPLATLIADLTRENRQLAEAATLWQVRAAQAEERASHLQEQLLALTSGEVEQDTAASRQDAPGAATEADAPGSPFVAGPPAWRRAPEAVPPPAPRRPWWRRLLGRPWVDHDR